MADRTVSVELRLSNAQYMSMLQQAGRATEGLGTQVKRMSADTERAFNTIGTAAAAFGAAGALALKQIADAAIGFESSFAGVIKTVDGTKAELDALSQGLRTMATRDVPVSVNALADIAASAGQLGIQTGNIEGFTRVIADLGVATNLSGEQAATSLARLANITGMSQSDFDRLGSTVVALGNNMATTESEIVEMSMRLAGAGAQVGLTESQILGFAAALSSVGVEAEAGGTAFSRVFADMAQQVASGGENLQGFAEVAGMTADEFATAFRDDAAGAVVQFIAGLDRIQQSGGDVFTTLEDLELGEIRVRDALLRTSGAVEQLTDAQGIAADAWQTNTALVEEAEQRYATTESQIQFARNAMVDLGIEMGENLLPLIRGLAGGVGDLAELFGDLPEPVQTLAVGFTAIASSVGLVGGAALLAILKLFALKAELAAVGITAGRTRAALLSLNTVPIVAAATAVAALTVNLGQARDEAAALADEIQMGAGDDPTDQLRALNDELERQLALRGNAGNRLVDAFFHPLQTQDEIYAVQELEGRVADLRAELDRAALAADYFGTENAGLIPTVDQLAVSLGGTASGMDDVSTAIQATVGDYRKWIAGAGIDTEAFGTGVSSVMARTAEDVEAAQEVINNALTAMGDGLRGFGTPVSAFEAAIADGQASLGEWVAEMNATADAQDAFADNMAALATRVSDETFAEFLEMAERNPEQAALMAQRAVEATDEELAGLDDAVSRHVGDGIQAMRDLAPLMNQVATEFGDGAVNALTSALSRGVLSVSQIAHAFTEGLRQNVNPILIALEGQSIPAQAAILNVPTGTMRGPSGDGPGMGDGPGFAAISDVPAVPSVSPFTSYVGEPPTATMEHTREAVVAWLEENLAPQLGSGVGWQAMWQALQQASGMGQIPGVDLFSAFRPGAITATGNPSYHGMGRAVDITPSMPIFEWIVKNYGAKSREIIYSPAGGRQIRNGSSHYYGEPTRGDHWDHIHWAMANGGIVRATPGGTHAILGEGGANEAVVPLDRPLAVFLSGASEAAMAALAGPGGFGRGDGGFPGRFGRPDDIAGREGGFGRGSGTGQPGHHRPTDGPGRTSISRPMTDPDMIAEVARNAEMLRIEGLPAAERLVEVRDELARLEAIGLMHTDEWVDALREAQRLEEQIARDAAAATKEIWDQVRAQRAAAEEAQAAADAAADLAHRQAEQVGAELDRMLDQRDRIIDQQAKATAAYAKAVAEAQRKAADDVNRLVAARNDALFGSFGALGQRFEAGWGNTVGQFQQELDARFAVFDEWADGLQALRDRGFSEDAIAAFGLDDPANIAQLRLFARATDAELTRLTTSLTRNRDQAAEQAGEEADLLLGALGTAILEVRAMLADTLAGLREDLTVQLDDLAVQMGQIGMDSGRSYAERMAEALASGLPAVIAIAEQYEQALRDAQAARDAAANLGAGTGGGSGGSGATGGGFQRPGNVWTNPPSTGSGSNVWSPVGHQLSTEQLRTMRSAPASQPSFSGPMELVLDSGERLSGYVRQQSRVAVRTDARHDRLTGVVAR